MSRRTHIGKRRPVSKYARRKQARKGKTPKTEAELRMQKNIREARRRKRNRNERHETS